MLTFASSRRISEEGAGSKGLVGVLRLSSVASGIVVGIFIGCLMVAPHSRRTTDSPSGDPAKTLSNTELLSQDEIQAMIAKALSRLSAQQALSSGVLGNANEDSRERAVYTRRDVELGVKNIRRLLPSVKRRTIEMLQEATAPYDIKPSERKRVARLIRGVRRVVRSEALRGMAAVRDDRLSEILVDPEYAPYLTSDDEAVFVLAHELTHVAARSGKLDRFIRAVADIAKQSARVEPTDEQREDLACDFVGELVLKRFIELNPTDESVGVRVSKIIGFESPAERFARAWSDFCASYNGDPGDDDHLTQYQTIRALLALDPELQTLMPTPAVPTSDQSSTK